MGNPKCLTGLLEKHDTSGKRSRRRFILCAIGVAEKNRFGFKIMVAPNQLAILAFGVRSTAPITQKVSPINQLVRVVLSFFGNMVEILPFVCKIFRWVSADELLLVPFSGRVTSMHII